MLLEKEEIIDRWKEYFETALNTKKTDKIKAYRLYNYTNESEISEMKPPDFEKR